MPLTNFPFGGFFAKPSVRAALPGSALLSANGAGFDLVGKVLQVNDPTGTYGFSYDNMGRLIGTTTQYTFLPSNNFTNSYTYDADSNRLTLTDPQGGVTSYAYDTLNRLSTLTPPTAFSSTGFGFTYDALSRRTQMTRPNGVTTNYTLTICLTCSPCCTRCPQVLLTGLLTPTILRETGRRRRTRRRR